MTDISLPVSGSVTFEELKKSNEHGAEYWSARELQPLLGYGQWRRFEDAINRAMVSCGQSGNKPDYHFAGAGKMIATGKGAVREAIKRIGGAMPETIPPAEHISIVEKRIKSTPPLLKLDGSDAQGLVWADGE